MRDVNETFGETEEAGRSGGFISVVRDRMLSIERMKETLRTT